MKLRSWWSVLALPLIVTTTVSAAGTVVITPCKDNTLIETADGSLSNGLSIQTFCGKTNFFAGETVRRSVQAFNIAGAVPPGSVITGVSLDFVLFQAAPTSGNETHNLHRLTSDWGEGTSDFGGGMGAPSTPGDATWLHTFWPTDFWTTPGGDFDAAISASAVVGMTPLDVTTFSSPGMIADVQAWLDDPASNFGWIMIGNESIAGTAKSFFSVDAPDEEFRPQLTIEFDIPPGGCLGDTDNSGIVDVEDLINVILDWGCEAGCEPCVGDTNADGTTDVEDLINVILNWGPCPP
jgi:hypothetical protein